jgi:hypothetical protein
LFFFHSFPFISYLGHLDGYWTKQYKSECSCIYQPCHHLQA